ncbi:hypothetical protein MOUN0_J05424 [Monosporozyma unispora]|nr:hypothetical protein C6P44_003446 [Kazachstania unispora]
MAGNSTFNATQTNSALVSNGAVRASSVTALKTNSALVSNGAVAASSVSAKHSNGTSSSVSKGAAVGLVANPISWKYGVAILVSTIGSYILGSEF